MFFAEELAKLANLGIRDLDGSLLGLRGNHIVNRQARGGGNSNCRWAGILIVADQLGEILPVVLAKLGVNPVDLSMKGENDLT
jgi:hypothetical protein